MKKKKIQIFIKINIAGEIDGCRHAFLFIIYFYLRTHTHAHTVKFH